MRELAAVPGDLYAEIPCPARFLAMQRLSSGSIAGQYLPRLRLDLCSPHYLTCRERISPARLAGPLGRSKSPPFCQEPKEPESRCTSSGRQYDRPAKESAAYITLAREPNPLEQGTLSSHNETSIVCAAKDFAARGNYIVGPSPACPP